MTVTHSENVPGDSLPAANGIGRRLSRAREARGLSVGDAAQALKLTLKQVEALEGDHFERLPGPAFARGFLRNYARLVQLDAEPLIAEFDAAYAGSQVELRQLSNAQGALPTGARGRGPSPLPAALVAAGLLTVVVTGWYFDWFRQPELEAPLATTSAPVVLAPAVPAPTLAEAAPGAAGAEAGAKPAGEPPAPVAAPATPASPSVLTAADAPAGGLDGLQRLTFGFDQEAWVEVRDASGEIIYSRIGAAGSSQEVQGRGPFAVVIGNAQNVHLSQNGKPVDLVPYTKVSVARLSLQ